MVAHSPPLRATDDGVSISDDEIAVSPAAFFYNGSLSQGAFYEAGK